MKKTTTKSGLKARLMLAFLVTSIIPLVLVNLFSYYNTANIVKDNVTEMTSSNLQQARENMDIWLESYEDILWQIYTDDDIVNLIDKINRNEDVPVSKNQLQRTLHGLFYTKEYIKCISVLTDNGTLIFYDLISGSSTRNSWINKIDMTKEELYETISQDNQTHVISTHKAMYKNNSDNYLFHLGHRIIDYRNVDKQLGIVVVSIDENLLKTVCSMDESTENSINFIVDGQGKMVSSTQQELLTQPVIAWSDNLEERKTAYEKFIVENLPFGEEHITVNCVYDEKFGWDVINVSSQREVISKLDAQQKITLTVLLFSIAALALIIMFLINRLTGPLQNIAGIMKKTGLGELSARVQLDRNMPQEVETIAVEYNSMMDRLVESLENEKEAEQKQRNAEIRALEAQMNPHFLYNTLDTINWMAIDRDQYEISNSISALANILRYGIDNSNGIVTIRQEYDWLKKYLFLQQTRLKNTFQCEVHVAPDLMEKKIHKLLLQPFVENSILHGFDGVNRTHFLSVEISGENGQLIIEIFDNGKGIDPARLEQINRGIFPKSSEKNHIGMENAINRIHMYYGQAGKIQIESVVNEYTRINIQVPEIVGENTREDYNSRR